MRCKAMKFHLHRDHFHVLPDHGTPKYMQKDFCLSPSCALSIWHIFITAIHHHANLWPAVLFTFIVVQGPVLSFTCLSAEPYLLVCVGGDNWADDRCCWDLHRFDRGDSGHRSWDSGYWSPQNFLLKPV